MYPPPAVRTSQEELLGTTAGIILTVVAAVVGLALFLLPVFLAGGTRNLRRRETPHRGSEPGQGHWPSERLEDRHIHPKGSQHGRPTSWALVAVMMAAFLTGGLALIVHVWWLFWACAGVFVLGVPVGKAIGIMNDTVAWSSTPAAQGDAGAPGTQPDHARSALSSFRRRPSCRL